MRICSLTWLKFLLAVGGTILAAPALHAYTIEQWVNDIFDNAIGYGNFQLTTSAPEPVAKQAKPLPTTAKPTPPNSTAPIASSPAVTDRKLPHHTGLPFAGYLPEVGPPALRYKTVARPINRRALIPSPLPSAPEDPNNKDNALEKDPQQVLYNMISSIIAEEFSAKPTPPPDPTPTSQPTTSEEATVDAPQPTQLQTTQATPTLNTDETAENTSFTEFLNPDEIVLFFEEQTQTNDTTTNSVGIPVSIPSDTTPDASPYPSRATFEQPPEP